MEAEGIVEIKFKPKDQKVLMQRLDPKYSQLVANQMAAANLPPEEKTETEKLVKEREAHLMPLYHQVAVHFADLHDTPERMLEKGCINVSTKHFPTNFCLLLVQNYILILLASP